MGRMGRIGRRHPPVWVPSAAGEACLAAVLCRFAGARTALSAPFRLAHCSGTDAQQVLADCQCPTERGILTGCFTSFQLVSPGFSYQEKRIGTGRLKTGVFSYEERYTYWSALRDFHAFGAGVLHLVAACCGLLQLRGKNWKRRL